MPLFSTSHPFPLHSPREHCQALQIGLLRPPIRPLGSPIGTFFTCVSLVVLAAFVAVCIIAIIVSLDMMCLCIPECCREWIRVFGHVAIHFDYSRHSCLCKGTKHQRFILKTMFDDCEPYFLRESLGI